MIDLDSHFRDNCIHTYIKDACLTSVKGPLHAIAM